MIPGSNKAESMLPGGRKGTFGRGVVEGSWFENQVPFTHLYEGPMKMDGGSCEESEDGCALNTLYACMHEITKKNCHEKKYSTNSFSHRARKTT